MNELMLCERAVAPERIIELYTPPGVRENGGREYFSVDRTIHFS
jgi:hypothetical protein